jgi:hypothetical protein
LWTIAPKSFRRAKIFRANPPESRVEDPSAAPLAPRAELAPRARSQREPHSQTRAPFAIRTSPRQVPLAEEATRAAQTGSRVDAEPQQFTP